MASTAPLVAPTTADIVYPESDGKPIGETDFHITALTVLMQMLRDFFAADEKIYVGGDMMFYYEKDNPKAVKAPDVFVVKGVGKHKRRTYKLWEELVDGRPTPPCTIFEITSKDTRQEDKKTKYELYQRLGVQDYFLFDPLGEYLSPRLQGYTRVAGHYRPLAPAADGSLRSQSLGLLFKPESDLLRIIDAATGFVIPTSLEVRELAKKEAQRADAAEAKLVELQAELARLRGK